ncbi:DUF4402 domain-containing protein [Parasphingorhabdus sp.]|jgi:hypothetical protein|uniref:DUF4402 domain-containing protein n=1 Tax=Parasphingorhabdus sp. TaxID=2709688 RepID=UPI001B5E97E9|nr:DUF4402 domain-containing protein [Parasphingorhabdus sp.]MBQ0771829.1 DUF4402 domain-containing protein [Sphingomonadales bacterium]
MTRDQIFPRLIGCLLFVLAVLASAPAAFAQPVSGDSDAVVVSPLSLVPVNNLSFGNLIPGSTGGTAVISPSGSRTVSGSVVAAGGTVSNAEFQGYGSRNRYVYISTASSSYRLSRVGGGANMTLRSLTLQADNLTPLNFPGLFRIASTNVITLRIGGTLDVRANQQAGVYEGSFPITMNYY